jgi:hypothetical protein
MKQTLFFLLLASFLLRMEVTHAQNKPTLAERLGYPAGTKLLIVHADDLAVAHSENVASFKAIEGGLVSSASIMVPCPWLPEVAEYAKKKPDHDLGLHLTLTSEWRPYRWGPVASLNEVRSLTDANGYFHHDCAPLAEFAKPEEVERELRAQIEQAKRMGIEPTHLDSHMGCLFFQKDWMFEIYLRLGREYGIPTMVSSDFLATADVAYQRHVTDEDIVVDRVFGAGPDDFKNGMEAFYLKTLEAVPAGVSVMIIHLAFDDVEMQGMNQNFPIYPSWCAPWRQADYNFFTSEKCRKALKDNNIKLTTWKEVGRLLK